MSESYTPIVLNMDGLFAYKFIACKARSKELAFFLLKSLIQPYSVRFFNCRPYIVAKPIPVGPYMLQISFVNVIMWLINWMRIILENSKMSWAHHSVSLY